MGLERQNLPFGVVRAQTSRLKFLLNTVQVHSYRKLLVEVIAVVINSNPNKPGKGRQEK